MTDSASEIAESPSEEGQISQEQTTSFNTHEQEGKVLPEHPSAPEVNTMGVYDRIPSRKRELSGLLYMAATGTQPSGKALPSLFPERIISMNDHVNFAVTLNPHNTLLRKAVPSYAWGIAKELHANGKSVIEKRNASLAYLRNLKVTLKDANDKWTSRLPPGAPSSRIDFALVRFLVVNLKYPDASLAADLARGMQLVGEIPGTGVFAKRRRDPGVSLPEWRGGLEERNRAMLRRVTTARNARLTGL